MKQVISFIHFPKSYKIFDRSDGKGGSNLEIWPMESSANWESLLASEPRVLDGVRKLGPTPTIIQQNSIPEALKGKDILARARTGSGKTAAYIIPILVGILRSPLPWSYKALILVPTRELCKQVKNQFDDLARYCHISA